MRRRAIRPSLPLALILATTGCSFVFVNGPPRGHEEMAEFTCTDSRAVPVLDAVGAGLFMAFGVASLVAGEDEPDPGTFSVGPTSEDMTQMGAISLGVSVPLGVSSFVGFRRVNDCRDATRALQERIGGAP